MPRWPADIEPVRLLKDATVGSQVAMSGIDLEIPSGPPWIKHAPLLDANCRQKMLGSPPRGIP